jgi:ryanodine receptor 2
MKKYVPEPLDTSGVQLPADLEQLVEKMSLNVHEVWAAGRIAEGWTWGPERDDEKKHHPCLVAYEDLPESEREYDRHTAVETIKLILSLGYHIEK